MLVDLLANARSTDVVADRLVAGGAFARADGELYVRVSGLRITRPGKDKLNVEVLGMDGSVVQTMAVPTSYPGDALNVNFATPALMHAVLEAT